MSATCDDGGGYMISLGFVNRLTSRYGKRYTRFFLSLLHTMYQFMSQELVSTLCRRRVLSHPKHNILSNRIGLRIYRPCRLGRFRVRMERTPLKSYPNRGSMNAHTPASSRCPGECSTSCTIGGTERPPSGVTAERWSQGMCVTGKKGRFTVSVSLSVFMPYHDLNCTVNDVLGRRSA